MSEPKLDRLAVYGGKGLWIRPVYREGFQRQSITAVLRRGDRSDPKDPRNNPRGEDLPVRFIRVPGNQAHNVPAELFSDDGTTIRITNFIVKRIKDLTADDLRGSTPDTATPELVRYHLGIIDNTPLPTPEEVVTIWQFEYVPLHS